MSGLILFVCFVAFRPKSTAMVIAGRVGPDLDLNCFTLMVFLKEYSFFLKKKSADDKTEKNPMGES